MKHIAGVLEWLVFLAFILVHLFEDELRCQLGNEKSCAKISVQETLLEVPN